jgi:hypothetical protein
VAGFVLAARTRDRRAEHGRVVGELAAGVALVAEQRFAAVAAATRQQLQANFAFVAFWARSKRARGVCRLG